MKQDISALMDGELFDDEAEILFNKLKRKGEAREEWHTYHLISDVLRQHGPVRADITAKMRERLLAEPTVLSPRTTTSQKAGWYAFSAAASVMALTLVAWLSMRVGSETSSQMAAVQQSASVRAANFVVNNGPTNTPQVNGGVNDYLMAHQQFSPSTHVQGAASYIRTMVGIRTMAGRNAAGQ